MQLVKPTKQYEHSWKEALREFEDEGMSGFWNVPERPTDLDAYIQRTEAFSRGEHLPGSWPANTTYWLIDDGEVVGHTNVRHALTDVFEKRGGHIGYYIRPTARGKGYGTKILELALVKARDELGVEKILITCDDANLPSCRVVERNGGVLGDVIDWKEERLRRYWVG